MSPPRHHDEALRALAGALRQWLKNVGSVQRALVVDDLVGRLGLVLWPVEGKRITHKRAESLRSVAQESAGAFWGGSLAFVEKDERILWEQAWAKAAVLEGNSDDLRVLSRAHDHLHWFDVPKLRERSEAGPKVVAFLSFKGGVGRTTALASFAIQRARDGEHVTVVDMDLDAPGIGALLADDRPREQAPYGVVDFLIDVPWIKDLDITEYLHGCNRAAVTERGSISVMPAGTLDAAYLAKLARVDLDASNEGPSRRYGISALLDRLAGQSPKPDWILMDGRAGLSEAAGLLLSGIAHLHLIVATASEQSYAGVTRMIDHLGARRLQTASDAVQAEVVMVQSMVPEVPRYARDVRGKFEARMEDIFREHYYAKDADLEEDRWWSLADIESEDAPHRAVPITYRVPLVSFENIDEVTDLLADEAEYRALDARVRARFGSEDAQSDDDGETSDN